MPPYHIETDVEIRHRVPHGSRSHFRHAEIGVTIRCCRPYCAATRHRARTDQGLSSIIVFHAPHAAIDRRSPLRIPAMLIGGVGGPYRGELYTAAEATVYALSHPPQCRIQAAAINRAPSPGGGRVAYGTFR